LQKKKIAFVYISANSNKQTLDAAKSTRPYGFLVKPFREKDVLVMLDIAWYGHQQNREDALRKTQPVPKTGDKSCELHNIVGSSPSMAEVVRNIKIVGAADTSVLILGESGTGKELVAQGIHRLSDRKNKPLIVVNCAALPANLIESELFGHEKGSFTGALYKRVGKFEQANGGTIFLDEIGELTQDAQVKFLRVLQEKEIESIGGHPKKIDVRVIAATNRNLEDEMAAGRFRIDLFYRLNIFPITLPPLRDRGADVLELANHFLSVYARKQGKKISGFSQPVARAIREYSWPGNVRELENMMERTVLLTNGPMVEVLNLPKDHDKRIVNEDKVKTIEENERDHIRAVLEKCEWRVYGAGGAAEMLDINVSTLNSRIKKLGIEKPWHDPK
jgi:two-component system response regulator HydG